MAIEPSGRRAAFRRLHQAGCFVLPNPWDAGSARYLRSLGFQALATTSAGFAFSRGRPDGGVPRHEVLGHLKDVVEATELPVNADFESGFAADAAGVDASVRLCLETGVAGLSIEDSTGDPAAPLHPIEVALERLSAARAAVDATGPGAVLTARAECHLVGHPDPQRESLRRLEAYAAAGADCLYAPGLRTAEAVAAVVKAVAPRPVNVLASGPYFTVRQLEDLGVRRISVGGALARAAWGALMRAAEEIAARGTFTALGEAPPHPSLNALFREEARERRGGGDRR